MAKKNKNAAKTAKKAKKAAKGIQAKAMMTSAPMAASSLSLEDTSPKTDSEIVQEAYEDSLKNLLKVYFSDYFGNPNGVEKNFVEGLPAIRKARDRAIELVK